MLSQPAIIEVMPIDGMCKPCYMKIVQVLGAELTKMKLSYGEYIKVLDGLLRQSMT